MLFLQVGASVHLPLLQTPLMQSPLMRQVLAAPHCLAQLSPQSSAPSVAVSQMPFVQELSCWHCPLVPQVRVLQSQVEPQLWPTPHAALQPPPPLQATGHRETGMRGALVQLASLCSPLLMCTIWCDRLG